MRLTTGRTAFGLLLLGFTLAVSGTALGDPSETRVVREGIDVRFSVSDLREGEGAVAAFALTDVRSGAPLAGLRPAAWIATRAGDGPPDAEACKARVRSFLQGSLQARPDVDLNSFYVLALNREASISVIDPLLGFGGSRLYALVTLRSPGEDWLLSGDARTLFVTLPLVDQVAVVDTTTWKVRAHIPVGPRPTRLAAQPDGKYVWVGLDGAGAESGVAAIDTTDFKVAARIPTGAGHHEIAMAAGGRYAFVTNRDAGTLSVIDVQRLAKVRDIAVGSRPAGLAASSLGGDVYVVSEGDGALVAVNAERHAVVARLETQPGLAAVRFTPDGRWAFVLNRKDDVVHVVDAATTRIAHTVRVDREPDHVTFTQTSAYVRSVATEFVTIIPLAALGKDGPLPVQRFLAGQIAPGSDAHAFADPITPAPGGTSVVVANPADKTLYYYAEGMMNPMGSFQNYRRTPRAALVVDRGLRETEPGRYSTAIRLPSKGTYDVALLVDSPRLAHCFTLTVSANPALTRGKKPAALRIEPLLGERGIPVGESVALRFKVTDTDTGQPRDGLRDVSVLTVLAPAVWQTRHPARPLGDGVYEATVTVPSPGVYYVFVAVPSLRVGYAERPPLIVHAKQESPR